MKATNFFLFLLLFGILCQGSCAKWSPEEGLYNNEERATQLTETTENVTEDGLNIVVNADIWIDKMPKVGGQAATLNGVVTLEDLAGQALPADASIRQLYIVNQSEIWVVSPKRSDTDPANSRSAHFGDGPDWKKSTNVQLICQFTMNGKSYMVRNSSISIHTVY